MGTPVLEVLKQDEDFSYVVVYRERIGFGSANEKLGEWSILIVRASGEVFGSGRNCLVEGDRCARAFPMKEGCSVKGEFVKVEMLSALKPKKLAVGLYFGAALSKDNKLLMFAHCVPEGQVVMVHKYQAGPCHCGNQGGGSAYNYGGYGLLKCGHSLYYYFMIYTHSNPPPPGVGVVRVVYSACRISCHKCHQLCGDICLNENNFNICTKCNLFPDVALLKSPYELDSGVIDMDAGETFICSVTEDFKVKLYHNGKTVACQLPEHETALSVSCGQQHFAVTTKSGHPYSYGDDVGENFQATSITLRKLVVPAAVRALKVSCWKNSTAWLLEDKTVYIFKNGVPSRVITAPWFCNCSIKTMMDELYEQSVANSISQWLRAFSKIFEQHEFEQSLATPASVVKLEDSTTIAELSESDSKQKHTIDLPPEMTELFGNERLSDLTIKLADGDLPAHWLTLISTSKYFKEISMADDNPSVLDMTSYNPKAYRCLIQHFYRVTPEDLPVADLLDVLELATSYEEKDVVQSVTDSLKSLIQGDNVLGTLRKARSLANQDLIDACETYIRSAAFRDYFTEMCIQDKIQVKDNA